MKLRAVDTKGLFRCRSTLWNSRQNHVKQAKSRGNFKSLQDIFYGQKPLGSAENKESEGCGVWKLRRVVKTLQMCERFFGR